MGEQYARLDELRAACPEAAKRLEEAVAVFESPHAELGFVKLRICAEEMLGAVGLALTPPQPRGRTESLDLYLKRLQAARVFPTAVKNGLYRIKEEGNDAAHGSGNVGAIGEVLKCAYEVADWFLGFSKANRKGFRIGGIEHLRSFNPELADRLQHAADVLTGYVEHEKGQAHGLFELREFARIAAGLVGEKLGFPPEVVDSVTSAARSGKLIKMLEEAGAADGNVVRAMRELQLADIKFPENATEEEGNDFFADTCGRMFDNAKLVAGWYLLQCGYKMPTPKVRWKRGTLEIPPDPDAPPREPIVIRVDPDAVELATAGSPAPTSIGRVPIGYAVGVGAAASVVAITLVATHSGGQSRRLPPPGPQASSVPPRPQGGATNEDFGARTPSPTPGTGKLLAYRLDLTYTGAHYRLEAGRTYAPAFDPGITYLTMSEGSALTEARGEQALSRCGQTTATIDSRLIKGNPFLVTCDGKPASIEVTKIDRAAASEPEAAPSPTPTSSAYKPETIAIREAGEYMTLSAHMTYDLDVPVGETVLGFQWSDAAISDRSGRVIHGCGSSSATIFYTRGSPGLVIAPCYDSVATFKVLSTNGRSAYNIETPTPTPTPTPVQPILTIGQAGEYKALDANVWYRFLPPYGSLAFLVKQGGIYVKDVSGNVLLNCEHGGGQLSHPQGAPDLLITACDSLPAQVYALDVNGRTVPEQMQYTAQAPTPEPQVMLPDIQIPQIVIPAAPQKPGKHKAQGGYRDPRYH